MSSALLLALFERTIAPPLEQSPPMPSCGEVVSALRDAGAAHSTMNHEHGDVALDQFAAKAVDRVCFHLQERNQFVLPSDARRARLREAVIGWLEQLRRAVAEPNTDEQTARMLSAANQALREAVHACQADESSDVIAVSAQYSIETQLEVLHVDPNRLLEPIVDLGCGREATLVTFLRQRGANAIGIDKFAPSVPFCFKTDWLQVPFPPEQFGSVLSHLGFGLHFLHQHLRPNGQAREYANAYMTILRALRPSGTFAYAPGLPFIERLLPTDQYKVERYPIAALPMDERASAVFEQGLGESPMYAAHVTRLPRQTS